MIATHLQTAGSGIPAAPEHVPPVVFIVHDDPLVREPVESLVRSKGWHPRVFTCAREFLSHPLVAAPSCLVTDISLPDVHGFALQAQIAAECAHVPLVFVAACGDVPTAVRAMKHGAVDFLLKPIDESQLLNAIAQALERSRAAFAREAELRVLRACHASLTSREREVMALITAGRLNKQAAGELGISEVTVKAHRGKMMRKMNARSLAALVDMAVRLRGAAQFAGH
jgi:FixJ family two-component response regulator